MTNYRRTAAALWKNTHRRGHDHAPAERSCTAYRLTARTSALIAWCRTDSKDEAAQQLSIPPKHCPDDFAAGPGEVQCDWPSSHD